ATEILVHYGTGLEIERLLHGAGLLELLRTQDILERSLPPAPGVVVDVGGGPGVYACWLARKGYAVHLFDPIPLHIEQARQAALHQPDRPLASLALGDARALDRPSASADVVLLLGPLYHLVERRERIAALTEAARVLKPGGMLFAVGISRWASLLDGVARDLLADPAFVDILERDLRDGQHRNPTNHLFYFTTAYFHHPDQLAAEVREAGLTLEQLLGIEGPAWLFSTLDQDLEEPKRRARLLSALRRMEAEPSLLGVSAH